MYYFGTNFTDFGHRKWYIGDNKFELLYCKFKETGKTWKKKLKGE